MGVKAGTFVQKTSPGAQAIAGLGFQPQLILFFSSGVTSSGSYADHQNAMHGMTVGTAAGDNGSVSTSSQDGQTTGTHNSSGRAARKAITFCEFGDALKAESDLTSFDADGFTLNWTTADAVARIINFIAVDGFTDVKVIEWQLNGSAGNQSVTGVGFTPDVVISIWEQNDNLNSTPYVANDGGIGIGAFDGTVEWGMSTFDEEGNDTTTRRNQSNVDLWAGSNVAGTARYANFVSMDADGFTINVASSFTPECIIYSLCLKGGPQISLGSINKPANQTGSVFESISFRPAGVLLASARVNGAKATGTDGAQLSVGVADENDQHATEWFVAQAATSDAGMVNIIDRCILMNVNHDATIETQGSCEQFTSDGFNINWGASSGVSEFLSYIAFEESASDQVQRFMASISTMDQPVPWAKPNRVARMPFRMGREEIGPAPTPGPDALIGMFIPRLEDPPLATAMIKMEALQELPGADVLLENVDAWGSPLSMPFELERLRIGGPNNDAILFPVFEETITVDKWYTPFTQNFHRDRLPPTDFIAPGAPPVFTPEEITVDKWFTPFTQNFHRKRLPFTDFQAPGPPLETGGEEVLLDKWYVRLSEPNRLGDEVLHRALLTALGVIDVIPIPDPALLPTRIPWDTPLSYEFRTSQFTVIPPMEVFVNLVTEEPIHPDALFGRMGEPNPRLPRSIIHQLNYGPYPLGSIFELENITLDKWYTPLGHEFRSLFMPVHLIPMERAPESRDAETIFVDKYYNPLAIPVRRTALQDFGHLLGKPSVIDPDPIPDVPGVTDMVFSLLSQPIFVQPWLDDWRRYEDITILAAVFVPFCPRPLARPDVCDTEEVAPKRPDQGFARGIRADEIQGFPTRPPFCPDQR